MTFDNYLSAGVHIGMKQRTKDMAKFIFKIRPDGLSILNVQQIDERLKIAGKFLSSFKKPMIISRKGAGQKWIVEFGDAIGGKSLVGRFLPGTVTNPSFRGYYEPDVILVADPLIDKQALREAVKTRVPIIALCDTFNETGYVDLIIPCNNKGKKALFVLFKVLGEEVLRGRGVSEGEIMEKMKNFVDEDDAGDETGGENGSSKHESHAEAESAGEEVEDRASELENTEDAETGDEAELGE